MKPFRSSSQQEDAINGNVCHSLSVLNGFLCPKWLTKTIALCALCAEYKRGYVGVGGG